MESGAPGKEHRAGVALMSEGFGSETARNGWKEESPRRNEQSSGGGGLKDDGFASQFVASALGPARTGRQVPPRRDPRRTRLNQQGRRGGVWAAYITLRQADDLALLQELTQGFDEALIADLETGAEAVGSTRLGGLGQDAEELFEKRIASRRVHGIGGGREFQIRSRFEV